MEELNATKVHRGLGSRVRIMGVEFFDIVLIFAFASVMNLFFVGTPLEFWMVYALPTVMGGVLFRNKRGKPERYLIHLLRYHTSPGRLSAGAKGEWETKRKRRMTDE